MDFPATCIFRKSRFPQPESAFWGFPNFAFGLPDFLGNIIKRDYYEAPVPQAGIKDTFQLETDSTF